MKLWNFKVINQKLMSIESKISSDKVGVGDFSTLLSYIHSSSKLKSNRKT